jgi:hypothetical protein
MHVHCLLQGTNWLLNIYSARPMKSGYRLVKGSTVLGPNPGGGETSRTRQDLSYGPPSLVYKG